MLPFQCRCSIEAVILQLTNFVARHRHWLIRFPDRRHNLFNTPFYNIRFFLPGKQHDFTGTVPYEYLLTSLDFCIMPSDIQNSYRIEQVINNGFKVKSQSTFAGNSNYRTINLVLVKTGTRELQSGLPILKLLIEKNLCNRPCRHQSQDYQDFLRVWLPSH